MVFCPGSSLRRPSPVIPLRAGKEHGGNALLLQHVLAAPAGPRRAHYEPSLILLWWERYRLNGFAGLRSSLRSVPAWWDWWHKGLKENSPDVGFSVRGFQLGPEQSSTARVRGRCVSERQERGGCPSEVDEESRWVRARTIPQLRRSVAGATRELEISSDLENTRR